MMLGVVLVNIEFCSPTGAYAWLCVGNFDAVASRLKKGKIKPKDLPTINEAFDIIKKMIEEAAKKEGMTYEEFVAYARKKAKEEEEKKQQQNSDESPVENTKQPEPEKSENPPDQPKASPEVEPAKNESNPPIKAGGSDDNIKPKEKTSDGRIKPKGGKPRGSGKHPIAEIASRTSTLSPTGIFAGDFCSGCHSGTMHPTAPGVIGRIQVNATFIFEQVVVEKLRCNSCGQTVAAMVPPEISQDHIRGASFQAAATLLVMRHHLAIPNLRIERLNGWLDTPLSDSRQWDIMRDAAHCLLSLYRQILQYAADATVQVLDDGWCRIICIHRQIREEIKAAEAYKIRKEDLRTGVNTTVVLGYEMEHAVCAYISGRKHQGENAHILDGMRINEASVIRMSDAAAKATATHKFPDQDIRGFVLANGGKTVIDSRVQIVHCLTHLRNKFNELVNHAPELCAFILKRISSIYDVDDEAMTLGLAPQKRMVLHQTKSFSLVQEIRERVVAELKAKNWLPKEPIGQALSYTSKNLDACTAFLRIPGCPLDSNAAERGIIPVVRHRLASLAFQTEQGAFVGDIAMTLAGSAILKNKNPIEYISHCLEFSDDVRDNPTAWFPWNYEERWKELKNIRIAERESHPIENYRIVNRQKKLVPPAQEMLSPPNVLQPLEMGMLN